jgi:hypothetical protein
MPISSVTLIVFVAYSTVLTSLILHKLKSKDKLLIGCESYENKAAKLFKLNSARLY